MVELLSTVISERRAEQASGTSTTEKTDLLQVCMVSCTACCRTIVTHCSNV